MEIKLEYLEKKDNSDKVVYRIKIGTKILASIEIDKEEISFEKLIKKKIDFIEKFCIKHPNISRYKLLSAFADIDDVMKIYFKKEFPTSNLDENGYAEFKLYVTNEEKIAILKFLNEIRHSK